MTENILPTDEVQIIVGTPNRTPLSITGKSKLTTGIVDTYGQIFYNNIQVSPTLIDVGNLTSVQVRTVTVFNAYTVERVLTSIQIQDSDGIAIIGPARPATIPPLGEIEYDFVISLDGPPTIDAKYTFIFDNVLLTDDSVTVNIVGSRIVSFPFYFNTSATETFTWNTSVITSYDGTEQRAKMLTIPRQRFEGTSYVPSEAKGLADIILYGWRGRDWALPLWQEAQLLPGVIPQGTLVINVDTTTGSFEQNGLVMLWQNEFVNDTFIIDILTDTSITLDRATETDFRNTVVSPIMLSRMPTDPTRSTNGNNGFIAATFEATGQFALEGEPSSSQFKNHDVFEGEALLNGSYVEDAYRTRIDEVDFKTGRLSYDAPWNITKTSRQFRVILEGQEQIWDFKKWLYRRSGKWRPFWMNNREPSFRLIDRGPIGATFFAEDDAQVSQAATKTAVTVVFKNGNVLNTGITSQVVDQNNEVAVTVEDSINATVDEIDYISYLGFKRLGSDRMTIVRYGNNVAECIIPIVEIEA